MNTGNRRSTQEEVSEMKKLCSQGLSVYEIAEKLNKDRTTILYQLKKLGRKPIKLRKKNKPIKPNEPSEIMKKIKQGHFNETSPKTIMKQRIKDDVCIICGKSKIDKKWIKTNYCSLKCFLES